MSLIDTNTKLLTANQVAERRAEDGLLGDPGEYRAKHRWSQRIPAERVARARRPVCEAVQLADDPTQPISRPQVAPPVWPLPRPEAQVPVVASASVPVPVVRQQVAVPLPARETTTTRLAWSSKLPATLQKLVANAGRWVRRG